MFWIEETFVDILLISKFNVTMSIDNLGIILLAMSFSNLYLINRSEFLEIVFDLIFRNYFMNLVDKDLKV